METKLKVSPDYGTLTISLGKFYQCGWSKSNYESVKIQKCTGVKNDIKYNWLIKMRLQVILSYTEMHSDWGHKIKVFKTVVNLGVLYMCSKYPQNLLATLPVDIYCHE